MTRAQLLRSMDPAAVRSVAALLIMICFAVGYSVGSQFVRGIAHDGAPQAVFAALICVICLAVAYIAAKVASFDLGFAAGLYAGATTISASIGLATGAINNAGVQNASELLDHMPVAYAVTYLFGTVGTGAILAYLGPTLLGVDLVAECKRYETEHNKGAPEGGIETAWHQLEIRAFQITEGSAAIGKTVAEVEALHPERRMFIEGIRRGDTIIEFDTSIALQSGDVLAVSGHTKALIELEKHATEIADQGLLAMPVESVDVFVSSKASNGKTVTELAKEEFARGVCMAN